MVAEAKKVLRKNILAIRDSLSEEEVAERSGKIAEKLFGEKHFRDAKTVAFYIPKGNEVQTKDMIEHSMAEKKEVLVPVTNNEISMCKFTSFFDLVPGRFRVPEPKHRHARDHAAEVVLVPGIVFGLCMHRIGFGKGYYDKYFKKNPKVFKIGLCYDFQVMDELPKHGHDIPMDLIITDKRLIKPSKH